MYLILSRDITNLADRIYQTIKKVKPETTIRIVKITPSEKISTLLSMSRLFSNENIFLTDNQGLRNRKLGIELLYNPILYKEQLEDPNLALLEKEAEHIIQDITSFFCPPKIFLTLLFIAFGGIETYLFYTKIYKNEETWKQIVAVLLILTSLVFTFSLIKKPLLHGKDKKDVEQFALKTGLVSLSSTDLITENYSFLRLLETEENESVIKKILKVLFESPQKATLYTTRLVKQLVPSNSETYKNYMDLLKQVG
jgi:hypothetical protein